MPPPFSLKESQIMTLSKKQHTHTYTHTHTHTHNATHTHMFFLPAPARDVLAHHRKLHNGCGFDQPRKCVPRNEVRLSTWQLRAQTRFREVAQYA